MKTKLIVLALALAGTALAADLVYSEGPQTGDSDLVLSHKQAVSTVRLERGDTFKNIATNGTNNISGPVRLGQVIVGKGGTNSTVVLSEVTATATNTIATIVTTSPGSLAVGALVNGTLRAVTAGDSAADVTLTYR